MAKKALLDVLEQTIGKYVRNLDAESLNVAVWSGKIELNSLELDVVAVNGELDRQAAEAPNLAIPFRVVSGQFGNFTVDVPWANLMSKSVILRASSLTIALEPFDRTASADFLSTVVENESIRATKIIQQRKDSLGVANDFRQRKNALQELAEQDVKPNTAQNDKSSGSFGGRLVRRIIENIQVEIYGVKVTLLGSEYSAGIVLNSLQLVTTDKNGERTFVDRTKQAVDGNDHSFLYKALSISGLGFYLDDPIENRVDRQSQKSFRLSSIGEENIDSDGTNYDGLDHSYILAPLSFDASLRQADSNVCIDFPRYFLRSELNSLSILVSRRQVELTNYIAKQIRPSKNVARPLFPEYRPLQRVSSETAMEWWKYAARCIGRLNGRRSWREFLQAFQKRKRYVPLYKRFIHADTSLWMTPLNRDEVDEMESIEMDRSISVEGIMYWRNISDAQFLKEQEKHNASIVTTKKSIFSSLFGSSTASSVKIDEEEPPISLSKEEMTELENIEQVIDSELTNDSQLYDVSFILRSLNIHLTSFGARQLAALDMGTVSARFLASADGSYNFDFGLASLAIHDKVTLNSFFPTILRNQRHILDDSVVLDTTIINSEVLNSDDALRIQIHKTKDGHQKIKMKLSTFEAIASSLFFKELQRFANTTTLVPMTANNALLTRSLSGSVDLFYDATDGDMQSTEDLNIKTIDWHTDGNVRAESEDHTVKDDLSHKLIDAWKVKTENKTTLTVDLDLQAPIIFIPESCVDADSNVLAFDLGHLQLNYGKMEASGRVKQWFQNNPRLLDYSESLLDNGILRINSLSFTIGKVRNWKSLASKCNSVETADVGAIIEPVSLNLNFGLESRVQDEIPRICLFGVLPSISFRLSHDQLSRIFAVSSSWKQNFEETFPSKNSDNNAVDTADNEDTCTLNSVVTSGVTGKLIERASIFIDPKKSMSGRPFTKVHAELRLQRLSLEILTKNGGGIQSNLVSVVASVSILSDGTSVANLSMGWFWILDRLEHDFPRHQRLIAHSKLPEIAENSAPERKYDFLERLEQIGVFKDDYIASTELANITYKQRSREHVFGNLDPFSSAHVEGDSFDVDGILDAQFSSLYIHWNPLAVKIIFGVIEEFMQSMNSRTNTKGELLFAESQPPRHRLLSNASTGCCSFESVKKTSGAILIRAKMDGLHLSLNSAKDDLPLFTLSMSSAAVTMVSSEDQNRSVLLLLGELKIVSPSLGRTYSAYRDVLGLASTTLGSLLSVRYYSGKRAIASASADSIEDCESYGEIELSPMRMVYIHAQVLALVEYFTAGILGALATQAVSSVALAAAEIAAPAGSKKIFKVHASHFELLLPTAAYINEFISINLGSLAVEYSATLEAGGEATISLVDVFMQDTIGSALLETPIRMDIKVALPLDDVGNKDDQAFRVQLSISNAPFTLSKKQYNQLFAILDTNVGEIDLCLRNEGSSLDRFDESSVLKPIAIPNTVPYANELSHAGVEIIDNPRRIYLHIDMKSLSLRLCGNDEYDPIVRISAVQSAVELNMYPDQQKKSIVVTLQDLFCNDERLKAFSRQHRSLIYQGRDNPKPESLKEEAFIISYTTDEINSLSSIDIWVGSPRFVLIPDAISDIWAFLGQTKSTQLPVKPQKPNILEYSEQVEVNATEEGSVIETTFVKKMEEKVSSTSFSMKTSNCSVVFVDLGTAIPAASGSLMLKSVSSVAETLVLGGIFHAKVLMKTLARDGTIFSLETEFHGEDIEAYTAFGQDLHSAVQILDPAHLALHYESRITAESAKTVDIRCAVLTPLDLTVSMRNLALLNAITTSLSDCFVSDEESVDTTRLNILSSNEAERIEHLASVLETDGEEDIQHGIEVTPSGVQCDTTETLLTTRVQMKKLSVTMTTSDVQITFVNDLQGLDEALFRVNTRNFVANGKITEGARINSKLPTFTAFDYNFHTSVLADYFDASSNTWKVLLLKPWEITSKGSRGSNQRLTSNKPSTAIDIDSLPCHVSFSEQFLMSLASANRMWAVYSAASSSAIDSMDQSLQVSKGLRRSMAASAARTFVASLPYALENHSGSDIEIIINGERKEKRYCQSGTVEYFRFEPPAGKGSGGKRLYGQDLKFEKSLSLCIGDVTLNVPHLDSLLGKLKTSHKLNDGLILMTYVIKEGKTITLHVSSGIEFHNQTSIPFDISILQDDKVSLIGRCESNFRSRTKARNDKSHFKVKNGNVSKSSRRVGAPLYLSKPFRSEWDRNGFSKMSLVFSPKLESIHDGWELSGGTKLNVDKRSLSNISGKQIITSFDITCRPLCRNAVSDTNTPRNLNSFVFQATISMTLVDGVYPAIDFSLEPRSIIANRLPVGIQVRSPMPHVFGTSAINMEQSGDIIHDLTPDSYLEVFTPGPSIAIMVKCSDMPVGGTVTDWMEGGWVDLPLVSEYRLLEPLRCMFPFVRKAHEICTPNRARGCEFFIVEGNRGLSELVSDRLQVQGPVDVAGTKSAVSSAVDLSVQTEAYEDSRTFSITMCNYAVDHTGNILFEQSEINQDQSMRRSSAGLDYRRMSHSQQMPPSFGAYATNRHCGRISMLPRLGVPIRMLHLTMEGDEGIRRSSSFQIEDVSICDGGVDSTPLTWENGVSSGFFAYRKLINSYQSEIHIVPEYIVYNGSEHHSVSIRYPGDGYVTVAPLKFAPIRRNDNDAAVISVEYFEVGGKTPLIRIDSLGLRVAVVKLDDGTAIGSVAVQTVMGARDSRLVVKLGDMQVGAVFSNGLDDVNKYGMLQNDFFRFRVRWSELHLTLIEARPIVGVQNAVMESALDNLHKVISPKSTEKDSSTKTKTWVQARQRLSDEAFVRSGDSPNAVCTICFHRFTIDWQRVFKEDAGRQQVSARSLWSPERSQLSVIIHHVQILDNTPGSPFPVVFDSTSTASFFDLCIRTRGSTNADLVQVDLIDLNLAHSKGISEKIFISTTEEFVWKLLDVFNRILEAAAEFAGVDIQLTWDEEQECFVASIREHELTSADKETRYSPPKSDKLYDIKKTHVSPFTTVVSFRRNPQTSRYKFLQDVKGGPIMNYFTRQLKFKIDKAELNFSRYEAKNVKGPPDRVMELLSTVYLSRVKTKLVTIMTAASFQDWKFLASRDDGDDEFMEGDILRVTGNLAGKTAGYVFREAGKGLGDGMTNAASAVGEGIEKASAKMGVRVIGAGMNSVVSGVGEGFGNAMAGVGTGTGRVLQGAGLGVGHVFGGISGGAYITGKGIVKGITSGDGRAAASGIAQGAATFGTGVGQGVESVVNGAAEGAFSVGRGFFSGVKNVGKGIGGAFTGKSPTQKKNEKG